MTKISEEEALPVPPAPRIGNYEILSEIARGGMGVVYKARQRGVNRIVALKMTLAGQFAGDEERRRFRAEAEAAGQLDHPHIVPIYEVGEFDGQPFFSMGYVEGPSLKGLLADGPFPPREAARLMQTIARAVHYAHTQGVIHRDLKPANVLMDAEGQPRVTDFGLAKRTTTDSGLTSTGQILGTPSYMPPEQAMGRNESVGPLSDVYSLGAMLYCLLTGRPPFQAATVVDTLLQVVEQEPVPPQQLNPNVPIDLETICLKCLEKRPEGRYVGAEEFANDLERWLGGLPVLARRLSAPQRIGRWIQRNRTLSALIASLLIGSAVSTGFAVGWRSQLQEAKTANATVARQRDALRERSEELQSALRERNDAFQSLSTRAAEEDLRRGLEECNAGFIDQGIHSFARARNIVPDSVAPLRFKIETNLRAWFPKLHRLAWQRKTAGPPTRVVFSRDGRRLAMTEYSTADLLTERTVIVDVASGQETRAPLDHPRTRASAFLASGESFVLLEVGQNHGSRFHGLQREWNLVTGAEKQTPLPDDYTYGACAISPDGRHAALSVKEGVRLWDTEERKAGPLIFQGADPLHTALTFSPDSKFLIAAPTTRPRSPDSLEVWDLREGEIVSWPLEWDALRTWGTLKSHGLMLTRGRVFWAPPVEMPESFGDARGSEPAQLIQLVSSDQGGRLLAFHRLGDVESTRLWEWDRSWVGQPLVGRLIQIDPTGKALALATDQKVSLWQVAGHSPVPTEEQDPLRRALASEPARVMPLIEAATGRRLDDRGQFRELSVQEWIEAREEARPRQEQ